MLRKYTLHVDINHFLVGKGKMDTVIQKRISISNQIMTSSYKMVRQQMPIISIYWVPSPNVTAGESMNRATGSRILYTLHNTSTK